MKLSKETIEILRNFAAINPNLVIQEGTKISTMSATKDILAEYDGGDTFDKKVAIFNLSELLGAIAAFSEPELVLEDKSLVIQQGKQKVRYIYADESVLVVPPKKSLNVVNPEVEITLTQELIARMQKMATILSVEDLAVYGDGNTISVKVFDKKNPTANQFEVDLEVATDKEFQVNFKMAKLRLFPSTYKVQITSKKISKWTAETINLMVYIAVESDSTFPTI